MFTGDLFPQSACPKLERITQAVHAYSSTMPDEKDDSCRLPAGRTVVHTLA